MDYDKIKENLSKGLNVSYEDLEFYNWCEELNFSLESNLRGAENE